MLTSVVGGSPFFFLSPNFPLLGRAGSSADSIDVVALVCLANLQQPDWFLGGSSMTALGYIRPPESEHL